MTALLIVLAPFVLLHILSWTPLPDKVPVRRRDLGGKNGGRVLMPVVDFLWFWGDRPHCYNAYMKEKGNRYLPPEYRA